MGKFWQTINGKIKRIAAGYEHEQEKFKSSAKYKAEQVSRVTARRKAIRTGRVRKGEDRDVDHKDSNPLNNSPSNIRVVSRKTNRGKTENSRKRGSGRNRSRWGR